MIFVLLMKRETFSYIWWLFIIAFSVRGAMYAVESFFSYHAFYGSLMENIFFTVYYAVLGLFLLYVSFSMMCRLQFVPAMRISIASSIILCEPELYFRIIWIWTFTAFLLWLGSAMILSIVMFRLMRSRSVVARLAALGDLSQIKPW